MKYFFLNFIYLFALNISLLRGTHIVGADLSYKWIGGNNQQVRFFHKEYFDCGGGATVPLPGPGNLPTLSINSMPPFNGGMPVATGGWTLAAYHEVTPICPNAVTKCTSNSATINGIIEQIYYIDYSFIVYGPCSYRVEWADCCRNSDIASGAANEGIYLSQEIYIDPTTPNSSPIFGSIPFCYVATGQAFTIDPQVFDPDGDSLVFSLGASYGGNSVPVSYAPGFSATAPLGPTWGITVDSATGDINLLPIPGAIVSGVLVLVVEEYRNGAKISTMKRDIQVQVISVPNPPNSSPSLTIQNTHLSVNIGDTLFVAPNSLISFDIVATDPNVGDIVAFDTLYSMTPWGLPFSWSITGLNTHQAIAHIQKMTASQGYTTTLKFSAFDNHCPFVNKKSRKIILISDSTKTGIIIFPKIIHTHCSSSNGEIAVSPRFGTPPYTFLWNTGATTSSINGLSAALYTVKIKDAVNDSTEASFMILDNNLKVSTLMQWKKCALTSDGSLTPVVTGGTPPYSYLWATPIQWSNNSTSSSLVSQPPGGYHVYVTDSVGCRREWAGLLARPDTCDLIIEGDVYTDYAQNCAFDPGDTGIPYTWVSVSPGGSTFTDPQGHYQFRRSTLANTTLMVNPAMLPAASWCSDDTLHTTYSQLGRDTVGNSFARYQAGNQGHLAITEVAGPAIAGKEHLSWLTATNQTPFQSVVSLSWQYDSLRQFVSAVPPPSNHNPLTRTLTWNQADTLPSMGFTTIQIRTLVLPAAISGSLLPSVGTVAGIPATFGSDTCHAQVPVQTGPLLPASKEVSPIGKGANGVVATNQSRLTYTIRFQNTSPDTAFFVTIRDTLDSDLDLTQYQHIASSFPYVLTVSGQTLIFNFNNINLPDSIVNWIESQGFVSFSVPFKVASSGKVATNRAVVRFDFIDPAKTNTVKTTLCDTILAAFGIVPQSNGTWNLTPSIHNATYWRWAMGFSGAGSISFDSIPNNIPFPDTGWYTITLYTSNACDNDTLIQTVYAGLYTEVDATNLLQMSIVPNPAQSVAKIQIAGVPMFDVNLTDAAGRVVRSQQAANGEVLLTRGDLSAGPYYVRATATDGRSAGQLLMLE